MSRARTEESRASKKISAKEEKDKFLEKDIRVMNEYELQEELNRTDRHLAVWVLISVIQFVVILCLIF